MLSYLWDVEYSFLKFNFIQRMRKIYPKLISVLFIVLFVAMILKYGDVNSKSTDTKSKTAQVNTDIR